MMSIFDKRFSTGQVVTATGLPNATLQSWLKRNLIIGHKDITGGGSPGLHRQFTFHNVMEIAIAKALTDLGLTASVSLMAGQHFAHTSQGPIGDQPKRDPGVPFDTRQLACSTLLCLAKEKSANFCMTEANRGHFHALMKNRLGDSFLVLLINPIFERVTALLGFNYRDVLADAYGVIERD